MPRPVAVAAVRRETATSARCITVAQRPRRLSRRRAARTAAAIEAEAGGVQPVLGSRLTHVAPRAHALALVPRNMHKAITRLQGTAAFNTPHGPPPPSSPPKTRRHAGRERHRRREPADALASHPRRQAAELSLKRRGLFSALETGKLTSEPVTQNERTRFLKYIIRLVHHFRMRPVRPGWRGGVRGLRARRYAHRVRSAPACWCEPRPVGLSAQRCGKFVTKARATDAHARRHPTLPSTSASQSPPPSWCAEHAAAHGLHTATSAEPPSSMACEAGVRRHTPPYAVAAVEAARARLRWLVDTRMGCADAPGRSGCPRVSSVRWAHFSRCWRGAGGAVRGTTAKVAFS